MDSKNTGRMDRRTRHVDNNNKNTHTLWKGQQHKENSVKSLSVCVCVWLFFSREGGGGRIYGGKKGTSGAGSLHLDTSSEACSSTTELNSVSSLK